MSLNGHQICPGCVYSGGVHLTTCTADKIPPIPGVYTPNNPIPVAPIFSGGMRGDLFIKAATEIAAGERAKQVDITDPLGEPAQYHTPIQQLANKIEDPTEVGTIEQEVMPSSGTKLVCTTCGRGDWHFLILRRRAGLLEGLCKQVDGSGCYPLASRRSCQYTYPEQMDCPQLAEYCVSLGEQQLSPKQVCRDHIGEMMRQGPLYKVWPIED